MAADIAPLGRKARTWADALLHGEADIRAAAERGIDRTIGTMPYYMLPAPTQAALCALRAAFRADAHAAAYHARLAGVSRAAIEAAHRSYLQSERT